MLAKKDRDNVCRGSAFNIASWSKKTEAEVLEALKVLASPDTKRLEPQPFDGRRIEKVDDGWLILNGETYQKLMKDANRRIYKTDKQREYRNPAATPTTETGTTPLEVKPPKPPKVTDSPPSSEHSAFVKGWCDNWEAQFGAKYNFNGRDAKAVSGLLATKILRIDLLEIAKRAWRRSETDNFCVACKRATTPSDFLTNLNQIQAELKKEPLRPGQKPQSERCI